MPVDDAGGIFEVSSVRFGRAVHLVLSGELDMATTPILDRWLSRATSNGNAEVIVDLDKVSFIDVTGLRALMRAADQARRSGQRFALVKAPEVVRRVIQLTNTTHLLHSETPTVPAERSNGSRAEPAGVRSRSLLHLSYLR